ncbi:MAG: endonuclease NucS [Candidatus Hatepunaea meridiana]|nr:endonuclease NucS [Candidatus Hatepunaea meridiana]
MKQCPCCESSFHDTSKICDICGYDFEKQVIAEYNYKEQKIAKNKNVQNWVRESGLTKRKKAERIRQVHKVQVGKYGVKLPKAPIAPGWRRKDTAELLGYSTSTIDNAFKNIKVTDNVDIHTFKDEDEMQKYFSNNWDNLFGQEWDIEKQDAKLTGKYTAGEAGEIDILAKHKDDQRWLIIELKVKRSSDDVVGQLLRYMGWVRKHKAEEDNQVEGVIIIPENISERDVIKILYALQFIRIFVNNIELMEYKLEGSSIKLDKIYPSVDLYKDLNHIRQLPQKEQQAFLEEYIKVRKQHGSYR